MALYKNISSVTFKGNTIEEVKAVGVTETGQEITSAADDASEEQLVDVVDQTTTVTIYTDDLSWISLWAQGGATGTLVVTVDSAYDDGGPKILTFSNCRFMTDDANPKHADVACAGVLNFECQSTDGLASPLAVTDGA